MIQWIHERFRQKRCLSIFQLFYCTFLFHFQHEFPPSMDQIDAPVWWNKSTQQVALAFSRIWIDVCMVVRHILFILENKKEEQWNT